MLHITNGDCTRDKLTRVNGDKIVWCDILHAGRARRETDEDFRQTRARFHAELGFDSFENCLAKLRAVDNDLDDWRAHDEIVLWYEHDLFDQLILIRLLNFFAQQSLNERKLSLVNVEKYARISTFFGIGELSPDELQDLFHARQPVSREQMNLARNAWHAFTAPDPRETEKFLQTDSSELPFLRAALIRFLQEFPSVENGLSRTEQNALSAMQNGARTPKEIFRAAQKREAAPFCGDTTFFALLMKLADGENPLFMAEQGQIPGARAVGGYFSDGFWHQQWILTPQGKRVLRGDADYIRLRGIDKYLGGVHLHSGVALWRWDEASQSLAIEDFAGRKRDWC